MTLKKATTAKAPAKKTVKAPAKKAAVKKTPAKKVEKKAVPTDMEVITDAILEKKGQNAAASATFS